MTHKQQPETIQATSPEKNYNSTKTRAAILLATLAVGGFIAYEKLSHKTNSLIPVDDTSPTEQSTQILPVSNNNDNELSNIEPNVNQENKDDELEQNDNSSSEININGYDKYIPNLPEDTKGHLNSRLYNVIKLNLKSDNFNIKDANIRDGSVEYRYDKDENAHYGSFIVDIESIKQSYSMTYGWSTEENNVALNGYTALALCLPSDNLVYGKFDCKDGLNVEEDDPIFEYLPYSTFDYIITGNYTKDSDKLGLDVAIILAQSDIRDGSTDAAVEEYKVEVKEWIRSKNQNPDDYVINYTVE